MNDITEGDSDVNSPDTQGFDQAVALSYQFSQYQGLVTLLIHAKFLKTGYASKGLEGTSQQGNQVVLGQFTGSVVLKFIHPETFSSAETTATVNTLLMLDLQVEPSLAESQPLAPNFAVSLFFGNAIGEGAYSR